jgi:long-chain fatty acid transport protein
MKAALFCGIALGAVAVASDASASPLIDLTGATDGIGGLQAGTVGDGASAAYFNPALLTKAPFGITIGTVMVAEQIGITVGGRPGTQYAVPDGLANATHADGSALASVPLGTGLLQNGRVAAGIHPALAARPRQADGTGQQTDSYEMVGFVAKLFQDRLAVGLYGLIPNGDFTNLDAFYPDEREQYFSNSLHPELYGDRLKSISIAFGAGVRLADNFSIGIGATLSLVADVGAPTYVANAGALSDLLIDTDAKVNTGLSPNMGISYDPTSRWHITGTAHAPEKVEMGVNFTFLLSTGLQQGSSFTLLYDYMPWQFGAGTSYDLVKEDNDTLTVVASAVYGKWSDYLDRHGDAPIAAYGWYDTITPAAGVRYVHRQTRAFADVQYKPSPVPLQTGRSDYVDNDRLGASTGVDFAFSLFQTSMRVGVQAEAYWLLPRYQNKLPTPPEPDGRNHYPALVADEVPDDSQVAGEPLSGTQGLQTNNPGWPGFGSQGLILSGGLYLTVMP